MRFLHLTAAAVGATVVLSGCVDNKYDLSDIDSTVRIPVNDLTLPINIDPIELSSIFDISDDPNAIVKIIDGEYVLTKGGSFHSNTVRVDNVYLRASTRSTSSTTIQLVPGSVEIPGWLDFEFSYDLTSSPMTYSINATGISESIRAVDYLEGSFKVSLSMGMPNLKGTVNKVYLSDLVLQAPAGLTATASIGTYDPATGLLTVPNTVLDSPSLEIVLNGTGIDVKKAGVAFNADQHTASLNGECRIVKGKALFRSSEITGSLPQSTNLESAYSMTDITVNSFTGKIKYDIDDVNFTDVTLNDLPDVLSQPGTNIRIVNPMIDLNVTNPLSGYKLGARTGMNIVSHFADGTSADHMLDAPGSFDISSAAKSSYRLAPINNLGDNSATKFVGFASLSDVVSGDGLPTSLSIQLVDPNVYEQPVEAFRLGSELGSVDGDYSFTAPLQLGDGSRVEYTETEDGWNDEDVNAITITTLRVSTTVSTNLPFDVDFKGYPIDTEGKQINGVEIEGAKIKAGATDQKVEVKITGTITHLDGIRFSATATVSGGDAKKALSPDMTIRCADIRATVGGYYDKEL